MRRLLTRILVIVAIASSSELSSEELSSARTLNPDEITVYFPAFAGVGSLGRNVTTVLSLQLAQTMRRAPWPENPRQHDFGSGLILWSKSPLANLSHQQAALDAAAPDVLAQIVVWGSVHPYGGDVVADVYVTLPIYSPPGLCSENRAPCDFRQRHIEKWTIEIGRNSLSVEVPSRAFSLSAISLSESTVVAFRSTDGLPIYDRLTGGNRIGWTGEALQFHEFNQNLPGAPTRLTSDGATGWVHLPKLQANDQAGEFTDMVGGLLRTMRGDWEGAEINFTRVVENPVTRPPLRLDALLLLGMVQTRADKDGQPAFQSALEQAPFDHRAVRYAVMGLLANPSANRVKLALQLLESNRHLFAARDAWISRAQRVGESFLTR